MACQSAPARVARLTWRVVFVVCRLCHSPFHKVCWSGLWLDLSREQVASGVQLVGLFGGLAKFCVGAGAQATLGRDCASRPFGRRLAWPCLVHGQAFEGAVEDGAGKSGARLRLDAALEAAEDGHVAGLQVRRASWWVEAQHDVWESGLHGGQGGLAGVDAGHVPREGYILVLHCPGSAHCPMWL